MRILIVFYSRTGTTRKVAEDLERELDADVFELEDNKDRSGILGYLYSAYQALTKKLVEIEKPELDPYSYDLIVVGTPVWAGNMAPAVRTFLHEYAGHFKDLAFFATYNGSSGSVFENMQKLTGMKPVSELGLKKPRANAEYFEKMEAFARELSS